MSIFLVIIVSSNCIVGAWSPLLPRQAQRQGPQFKWCSYCTVTLWQLCREGIYFYYNYLLCFDLPWFFCFFFCLLAGFAQKVVDKFSWNDRRLGIGQRNFSSCLPVMTYSASMLYTNHCYNTNVLCLVGIC